MMVGDSSWRQQYERNCMPLPLTPNSLSLSCATRAHMCFVYTTTGCVWCCTMASSLCHQDPPTTPTAAAVRSVRRPAGAQSPHRCSSSRLRRRGQVGGRKMGVSWHIVFTWLLSACRAQSSTCSCLTRASLLPVLLHTCVTTIRHHLQAAAAPPTTTASTRPARPMSMHQTQHHQQQRQPYRQASRVSKSPCASRACGCRPPCTLCLNSTAPSRLLLGCQPRSCWLPGRRHL